MRLWILLLGLLVAATGTLHEAEAAGAALGEEPRAYMTVKEGDRYVDSESGAVYVRQGGFWVRTEAPEERPAAPRGFGIQLNTQGGSVHIDASGTAPEAGEPARVPVPFLKVGGPAVRFPELAPNGKPVWRQLIDLGPIRQYFSRYRSGNPTQAVVPLSLFTRIDYADIETRCVNQARSRIYYTQPEYAEFHGEQRPIGGSWTLEIDGRVEALDLNVIWGHRESLLISGHPKTWHAMVTVCLEYTRRSDPVIDYPAFIRNDGAWVAEDGRVILK